MWLLLLRNQLSLTGYGLILEDTQCMNANFTNLVHAADFLWVSLCS